MKIDAAVASAERQFQVECRQSGWGGWLKVAPLHISKVRYDKNVYKAKTKISGEHGS